MAKWDDDDDYGPTYLYEALKTFENTNADILGKRTIFMYFPKTKELRLRFPGREFKFVKRVLGGTLIAKKTVKQEVPFLNISLHKDSNFIKNTRAKGYRILSTSKNTYVYFR
ncbi:hypothetical protein [Neobacillus terrae]|uniref:hypothetical protein n=1 Tax=Neobacillus terrae TaxID=3034837 RepID=UPI00140BFE46|nr:hypothetical protein [Neobacillus terrae]NHM31140.1 hypothetical protein [Neobacillus terrae]